jgi:uncharacterized protein (TIGR02996 family)
MDAGEALLARVVEHPDDEAAHLVYADWLEERGDPLAALIRAQRAGREPAADALAALDPRVAPLGFAIREPRFERGMLSTLSMKGGEYARQQAMLLPLVSRFGVRTTRLTSPGVKIPQCATLEWTSELRWSECQLDDAKLELFAASPHLARLSALSLENLRCRNTGLRALARSPHLSRVRDLRLLAPYHSMFDVESVIDLVEHMHVEKLDLARGFTTLDLSVFAEAPAIAKLSYLKVSCWPRDLAGIARSKHLTNLRRIELACHYSPSDDDIGALVDNPAFAELKTVWIQGTPSDAAAANLRARFGDGYRQLAYGAYAS